MKRALLALILTFALVCGLTGCGSTVTQPEIKEGEFNFSVTYEFNGEVKTVSGVYVCKYNGTSWALDGGYSRDWKGYIKDGKLKDVMEIGVTEDGQMVELLLNLCPEYFMDDFIEGYHNFPKPYILVTSVNDDDMVFINEPDEVEEYCGAKIISYEYDEPIKNSFS